MEKPHSDEGSCRDLGFEGYEEILRNLLTLAHLRTLFLEPFQDENVCRPPVRQL